MNLPNYNFLFLLVTFISMTFVEIDSCMGHTIVTVTVCSGLSGIQEARENDILFYLYADFTCMR